MDLLLLQEGGSFNLPLKAFLIMLCFFPGCFINASNPRWWSKSTASFNLALAASQLFLPLDLTLWTVL